MISVNRQEVPVRLRPRPFLVGAMLLLGSLTAQSVGPQLGPPTSQEPFVFSAISRLETQRASYKLAPFSTTMDREKIFGESIIKLHDPVHDTQVITLIEAVNPLKEQILARSNPDLFWRQPQLPFPTDYQKLSVGDATVTPDGRMFMSVLIDNNRVEIIESVDGGLSWVTRKYLEPRQAPTRRDFFQLVETFLQETQ